MSARREKVMVAMSGGVDSSVAAAILLQEGYDVVGVTMNLWPEVESDSQAERIGGCCSLAATEDARRVCHILGIPHYVLNFREVFRETVVVDFAKEYVRGRTPNPCIRCNQRVKFEALLHKAVALGAEYIATGHYARIVYDEDRARYVIKRGLDPNKDQSYALYTMTQKQLAKTFFPMGTLTKTQTRETAAKLGLDRVAEKPESQEICFIPDNDYPKFLRGYMPDPAKPGPILDTEGKVVGEHQGIIHYTIGQRKGIGVTSPHPLYVVAIDPQRDAVIVGPHEALFDRSLLAEEMNWIAIDELRGELRVSAKVRYRSDAAPAVIGPADTGLVRADFEEPQRAITPGQAVVFYEDDTVVGGGTIVKAIK